MKRSKPTSSSTASKTSRPEKRRRQTVAELRALQRLMTRAVMRPLTADRRMRPRWSDGSPAEKIAASFIKPNDRLSSFERLEIYNRQYWLRLLECFHEDYSGLRAVLGEERFGDLAVAYLANHPSESFTLRNLGRKLVDFIRAEPRWTSPRRELALDMARLEWAHIEAFDNEAKSAVTVDELLGRDAAQIHLRLQPHITLLQLAYPLDEYLIALREPPRLRGEASNAIEETANPPAAKKRPPKRRTVRLAVHRHGNVVYYKRLSTPQFELLLALQSGASLECALRTLAGARRAPPVQSWFKDWSALGWFWMREQK